MVNDQKKLSVIIPIYNVEKYLPKCIESVTNQTYKDLEIILVNDGSTDRCGSICDSYGAGDDRIKVVHKQNGGLSSARNIGLDKATGEYIAFLDSDDWIDVEMYETLINLIEREGAEIAVCGFKEVYENETIVNSQTEAITIYDKTGAVNSLFESNLNVRFEVWNKVFTRDIIGDVRFIEKQIFEDVYFDRNIFLKMNRLVYFDKQMHNYLKVRAGNTNSHFKENKLSVFKEFNDFISNLRSLGMEDSANRFEAYALDSSIAMYCSAFELNSSKDILDKLRSQHTQYLNQMNKNPYFNRKKSLIFQYLPSFYCWISKIKNKTR